MKKANNTSSLSDDLLKGLKKVETLRDNSIKITFANDTADVISWEQLIALDYKKWFVLEGKGVRFMRVKHAKKEAFFITEMDPELSNVIFEGEKVAEFGLQVHDCKELGVIKKGHLIELTENRKEYVKDDNFIFPINHRHKPISKIKSEYEVEFLNPNKI
jgi:hypothetical protein